LIYQHQHATLPLEQLEGVPQPVIVLLEELLERIRFDVFRTQSNFCR